MRKHPPVPAWKVWILIIVIIQTMLAILNVLDHQQMREAIHDNRAMLEQEIQTNREHYEEFSQFLEEESEFLEKETEFLLKQIQFLEEVTDES